MNANRDTRDLSWIMESNTIPQHADSRDDCSDRTQFYSVDTLKQEIYKTRQWRLRTHSFARWG